MRRFILATLLPLLVAAQTTPAPKQTPPPPTAPRAFAFPAPVSKTLPNGLKIYLIEDHRLPLVTVSLQILAGGAYTPPEKAGLATLTAGLLREGTSTRDSQQISKLIDSAGGALGASAGDDTANVTATFMKSYAGLAMDLLSDVVRNPVFAQEEIDRQLRQAQSGLAVSYQSADYLAPMVAARAILGTHPYAYPSDGTPQTLRNITRDDIVAFHKKFYVPSRANLAIAGDLTPDEASALAEKWLGPWTGGTMTDDRLPLPPNPKAQVIVVDLPTAVQTQIQIGRIAIPRIHPDWIALNLANQVFGANFNSRLNMKLRSKEGLTYGANSSLEANRQAGAFLLSTSTRTEKTADAIRFMLDEIKNLSAEPITQAEFDESRNFIIGAFGLSLETSSNVAGRVLTAALHQLGDDYWTNYRSQLETLALPVIRGIAKRYINTDQIAIVAVGNAKEIAKPLEQFGAVRVIAASDLDLVAPDLVKKKEAAANTPETAARAKQLTDAVIAALGGREKLAAVKDASSQGTLKLTLPQGSFDGSATEEVVYPDKYRVVITLPVATVTQALDGQKGWMAQGTMSQDLPPQLVEELRKSISTSNGGLGLFVQAAAGQAEITSPAPDTLNWKSGALEVKIALDPATHLPAKITYNALGMQGPAEIENTFSDWKDFGGLKLPALETTTQNGQKVSERTVTARKINQGIPPDTFLKK
jgi:zinc protease